MPGLFMADRRKSLPDNIPGEFFVDSSCIDCDTCRQLAPSTFAEGSDFSFVYRQPGSDAEHRSALRALIACPTASIGSDDKSGVKEVVADFPLPVADDVFYCGFNSDKSFGGNSYFVRHPDGNWLIDSPRYIDHLVRRFDEFGGVRYLFLTHRDDVADAGKYAERFSSERIIHRFELSAQPNAERVIDGTDPVTLTNDFVLIPTPGHTQGHCALLYRDHFLFTGDHLWWSREHQRLNASRSVCWYSWPQQLESLAVLDRYSFEWVLPGHGQRVQLPSSRMSAELKRLLRELT
jgi:glyoxylase-like metal-dependent hydrolase (beta-lactamase superfamily II)/ferredoxin